MAADKNKSKIRLIVKRNELIRDKEGCIISVTTNYETQDYELKEPLFYNPLADDNNCKYEIVSAELV